MNHGPLPRPGRNPVTDPLRDYAHLADVPLRVEALLDRLTMNMRAVASLEVGSVLDADTLRRG